MNNEGLFTEIRFIYQDLPQKKAEAMAGRAAASIAKLLTYSDVARKHGLLSLEYLAEHEEDDFLKKTMLLIVDGTDADLIWTIMFSDYLSKFLYRSPQERLTALLSLNGALAIQEGDNPHVIEGRLLALAPEGTQEYLDDELKKQESFMKDFEEAQKPKPGNFAKAARIVEQPVYGPDERILELTDKALRRLDPEDLAFLLPEVPDIAVVTVLSRLSGEAVSHIFDAQDDPMLSEAMAESAGVVGRDASPEELAKSGGQILLALTKIVQAGTIDFDGIDEYAAALDQYLPNLEEELAAEEKAQAEKKAAEPDSPTQLSEEDIKNLVGNIFGDLTGDSE